MNLQSFVRAIFQILYKYFLKMLSKGVLRAFHFIIVHSLKIFVMVSFISVPFLPLCTDNKPYYIVHSTFLIVESSKSICKNLVKILFEDKMVCNIYS